jgi:cytosine/uracil/thiamine/allantoin permease
MFMSMNMRLFRTGFIIWLAATLALRFGGQRILRADDWKGTLILFAVTFPLIAWLVRRLCVRAGVPQGEWLAGATSLLLPTLLLDPFSSAFFSAVFPNLAPQVAGIFGGWMLWCCAAALVGVSFRSTERITREQR